MLKKLLFFLCLSFFAAGASAQEFMHSFGATIAVVTAKRETDYSSSNFTMSQSLFSYFPRYNFVENDNSSISVGMPVAIGIGISKSVYDDDPGIAFAYDVPIVLDYNIGCKSAMDNEATFGGYFGAGFGFHSMSISKSKYSDFKGNSYGPIFRGGVRIGSNAESWAGHGITIGAFYKKGLEKEHFNTIGFNILYDL